MAKHLDSDQRGSARRTGAAVGARALALAAAVTAALALAPLQAETLLADATEAEAIVARALGLTAESKSIHVIDGRTSGLVVDIEPLRERVEVDEPIWFWVRGASAFYVYLYSVDEETGDSELIFPNALVTDNYYPSDRSYLIPNRDAEFYSDRPGTEQLVMVASREPLDIAPAALDKGKSSLLSAADFERMLSAKGLRLERDDREHWRDTQTAELTVKRLELTVTDDR